MEKKILRHIIFTGFSITLLASSNVQGQGLCEQGCAADRNKCYQKNPGEEAKKGTSGDMCERTYVTCRNRACHGL
jgi:hypothetical protein